MSDLVRKLCVAEHPVEVVVRPEKDLRAIEECIGRKFIHIRFTDTQGGTELGVKLESEGTDVSGADFSNRTGHVKLAGTLTLDYIPVRCVARVDLETFAGTGHLQLIEP